MRAEPAVDNPVRVRDVDAAGRNHVRLEIGEILLELREEGECARRRIRVPERCELCELRLDDLCAQPRQRRQVMRRLRKVGAIPLRVCSTDPVLFQRLADAAGVSRQHLTRVFRERIGVPPKLYCRLARFHSGLAFAGCGKNVNWAEAALDLGYADQSHMITEFREFSSLTPQTLASQKWFHPFIERAKARQNSSAL